jgi:hypothetical protein
MRESAVDRPSKIASSSDTFGDFLDSMSSVNVGSEGAASPAEAAAAAPAEAAEPTTLTLSNVLGYLGEHDGQSLPELAKGLRSPILQTAEMIGKLESSGLLTLDGKPGSERVRLTPAGRSLSAVK